MREHKNRLIAVMMKAAARKCVEMAADSRCMYIFHQPKQPEGVKKFKK